MTNRRILVLYGGKADEHSISCISAAGVLKAMDTTRFEPVPVGITKDGRWLTGGTDPRDFDLSSGSLPTVEQSLGSRPVVVDMGGGPDGFYARQPDGSLQSLGHIDAVLPVMHGPYGEDGSIQGLLETMGLPYVGCGVFASAACMDKDFTKVILAAAGIDVVSGITLDTRNFKAADQFSGQAQALQAQVDSAGLSYPLFVKPSRAGSSFGVTKLDEQGQAQALAQAVFEASRHDWKVLVEEGIAGREIECAVLQARSDQEPTASWPGEVVLDRKDEAGGEGQFYDFDSKYMDEDASHVEVPARLPQDTLEAVRQVAIKAFKVLDCSGLSRVDTFVTPQGRILVNEINTMPGFTPISMYPKAWEATGLPYGDLISQLIDGLLA
ncbi:D-alanine--D-alanine ligase A [Bifidobacterium aemilianum]|uniref:D-alanine--D-alanine ligase n=1 Tax=Bifidobacterium aemilianum TaxID=2493120 RepID=A0A366K882_9BIFI|nr:D-alanine--D-alanine ligase family protein [Bifidobacterium aemilianum]RBP97945.1 D-alanine--D-alanine ligase A [Bifidobacterium aemilianum]